MELGGIEPPTQSTHENHDDFNLYFQVVTTSVATYCFRQTLSESARARLDIAKLGRRLQSAITTDLRPSFSALTERQHRRADSTGQRNRLAEHFSVRFEAKGLARPLVQLTRN